MQRRGRPGELLGVQSVDADSVAWSFEATRQPVCASVVPPRRMVGRDRVGVRFCYQVSDGDTISFERVIPNCRPSCFDAIWSVAVAYAGYTWQRVG